jgi:hypothetical protein
MDCGGWIALFSTAAVGALFFDAINARWPNCSQRAGILPQKLELLSQSPPLLGKIGVHLLNLSIAFGKGLYCVLSCAPSALFRPHRHPHLKKKRRKVGEVPREHTWSQGAKQMTATP